MDADLVVRLVREIGEDVRMMIIHTDRGGQFMSKKFRDELSKYGMIPSMGRGGNCYDNARLESFFARLKKELLSKIPWKKGQRSMY
jgi:transposase InsO family protein